MKPAALLSACLTAVLLAAPVVAYGPRPGMASQQQELNLENKRFADQKKIWDKDCKDLQQRENNEIKRANCGTSHECTAPIHRKWANKGKECTGRLEALEKEHANKTQAIEAAWRGIMDSAGRPPNCPDREPGEPCSCEHAPCYSLPGTPGAGTPGAGSGP
jgi:hypothetical protein